MFIWLLQLLFCLSFCVSNLTVAVVFDEAVTEANVILRFPVEAMAGPVSLELDPIFLKGLSYLHSKSKDSAEKLKALLDESLARGSDSSYRSLQKVRMHHTLHGSSFIFISLSFVLVCN